MLRTQPDYGFLASLGASGQIQSGLRKKRKTKCQAGRKEGERKREGKEKADEKEDETENPSTTNGQGENPNAIKLFRERHKKGPSHSCPSNASACISAGRGAPCRLHGTLPAGEQLVLALTGSRAEDLGRRQVASPLSQADLAGCMRQRPRSRAANRLPTPQVSSLYLYVTL